MNKTETSAAGQATATGERKKVSIVNVQLSPFRIPFYNQLHDELSSRGIDLNYLHGEHWPHERDRSYECKLDWAQPIHNRFISFGRGRSAVWQTLPTQQLNESDLLIVTQENLILSNYPLILRRRLAGKRLAFWGHGVGPRSRSAGSVKEKWRHFWAQRADWWFAYTRRSVEALAQGGFPHDRISNLNNTVDNTGFQADMEKVSPQMLADISAACGINDQSAVGLFCGALYKDKRIDLLIEAADLLHQRLPDFRLIVIGSGAEAPMLEAAMKTRPWAHAVGPQSGVSKAAYFKLAHVVMNPGLIGLVVLDAFCAGLPVVTTGGDTPHSPEVVYLEPGQNGFFAEATPQAYADEVYNLLNNNNLYQKSRAAALAASKVYTMENMVRHFADGVEACLQRPIKT